jgi:PEP-CTERM motif
MRKFVNALLVTGSLILASPATAALVVLSFDASNACPSVCTSGTTLSPTYGSTAQLAITYRNWNQAETVFVNAINYSPLDHAYATGSNGGPEPVDFIFSPVAGFEVSLISIENFKIPPGGGTLSGTYSLFDSANTLISSVNYTTNTNTDPANPTNKITTTFNSAYFSSPLRLRDLAPSVMRYDTLILDVRAIAVQSAVPEPATWGMMLAGFGIIGAAMRRRNVLALV